MNRRLFLHHPLLIVAPTLRNNVRQEAWSFESNNKRMVVNMNFVDYDTHVLMMSEKIWYDPIKKDVIQDNTRQMFILEDDEM